MTASVGYKQASTDSELRQILHLQSCNLPENLAPEEKTREGFVTVKHNLELLRQMNAVCPHTLAVHNDKVIGYALSMHPSFGDTIPILKPMFPEIEKIGFSRNDFIVMGQICIAKAYRGRGVFRDLYKHMKQFLIPPFKQIITEVDVKNVRSLNAHFAIGFKEIHRYRSSTNEWVLISL
ncbi:GNAT family N-acetyltransferase [Flagellimonas lutaonensis]|uniref:GCN5 family acetyltransferase n=1 Tax=Flagellimonas lutaonensis TaxID=516051 RepID=A0A0D5YRA4_9FLAO|nr:GNAT family N-acetyltransferase [Allomuricauda lutaonensis]AKA34787.1 GCN5 family acetyltransferase [Allomuricauda lutaonensis]